MTINITYWISRFGYPERREFELDLYEAAVQDAKELIQGIGGFDKDALDTIEVDCAKTL